MKLISNIFLPGRIQSTLKLVFPSLIVLFIASCGSSKKVTKPAEPTKETAVVKPELKKDTTKVVVPPPVITDLQIKYAKKLDVDPSTLTNTKLYELIDKWWGATYKSPPGKTPEEGIDCSGFAALTLKTIYGKSVQGSAADISKVCKKISSKDLREGDLVFFCCTRGSDEREKITHVGIYLTNRMFVHASTSKGVLISSLDDPTYWKEKFVKSGRVKNKGDQAEPETTPEIIVSSDTTNSDGVEIGKASYYADSFNGKKTYNGEIFSQSKLTAAHKSLPFGTTVRVTNLKNNKSSVVVINDRLPKKSKRSIDLSRAAATEIDMIRDGLVQVKIEVIK